jgi:capsular exopolysaccharide synthesis family protein
MMGAFLAVIAVTAAVTLTMKPVYTGSVQLMIDKPGAKLLVDEDDKNGQSQGALDASAIETEVEVLRSPAIASAVVRDLQLERDPEFNPALGEPGLLARIRGLIPSLRPSETAAEHQLSPTASAVRQHLKVSRVGASYILRVDFTSRDPAKAARIANSYAKEFLRAQLDTKYEASREANGWLQSHIGELRQRVADAETALQNYKIQNGLLSAEGATLTEQEISSLNQQAALMRANQAETQARLNTAMQQLANGSTGEDIGETMNSPVIQQLRERRAQLSAQVANLQSRYGPRHPDLVKAQSELADTDDQIRDEIKRITSNLQAQAIVARERRASIDSSVAGARQNLAQNNRSVVRLNELRRDADAERTLYEGFLNKFKELSAEAGLAQTDAHIVSLATTPATPSAPKKGLNLALGTVLGLAAAVSAALLAEMFEKGLPDAEIIERELSVAYLGSIPRMSSIVPGDRALRLRPIDHLVARPVSSFAESFRSLRAAIEYSGPGPKVKVLAVTSSLSGEGKTTTSVGLARSAALANIRTVVVDCDLRQQSIADLLELSPKVGLLEVLNGTASLDEALQCDEKTGAMILPLVESHFTPEDPFNSPQMHELMNELRRRFDLVILDTPPVVLVTETRTVARCADAVMLLAHWRRTPRALVQTSLRLLAAAGANLVGVTLTQVDLRRPASVDPADPTVHYLTHRNYYVH